MNKKSNIQMSSRKIEQAPNELSIRGNVRQRSTITAVYQYSWIKRNITWIKSQENRTSKKIQSIFTLWNGDTGRVMGNFQTQKETSWN